MKRAKVVKKALNKESKSTRYRREMIEKRRKQKAKLNQKALKRGRKIAERSRRHRILTNGRQTLKNCIKILPLKAKIASISVILLVLATSFFGAGSLISQLLNRPAPTTEPIPTPVASAEDTREEPTPTVVTETAEQPSATSTTTSESAPVASVSTPVYNTRPATNTASSTNSTSSQSTSAQSTTSKPTTPVIDYNTTNVDDNFANLTPIEPIPEETPTNPTTSSKPSETNPTDDPVSTPPEGELESSSDTTLPGAF